MLEFPAIDPVIVELGPVAIRWYGLMYLVSFGAAWWLAIRQTRRPGATWTPQMVGDMVFYSALGVVLGGRTGYVFFYGFERFVENPLYLFQIQQGGMSFHGGLLGVLLAFAWFAHKNRMHFFDVADYVAPYAAIGLGAGRLGNFINAELWGRVTDVPWGIVFPGAGPLPRHPSQLYEALLEGLVLFTVLWVFASRPRPRYAVSGLFLLLYGVFRFSVEFVREPDAHLGFVALGWMSMGQVLTVPMIAAGAGLLWLAYREQLVAQTPGAGR